ncbi:hypothetical protein FDI63_gp055 [Mycobacterium phage ChrisnMich]|uniref:Uncharacterized protein n=1 Tax=Mycobacterium phage ChrisnMich TaxID=1034130 RepID=G1BLB2_9CAUD|nr:hypothetical protein FDI63_gp055 [Mycobacterium phage ChrisnMich]AEJ94622.1 hypothetical protein CHRISNMICH_55 [Mycobacterium phage ChrisnMich]WNM65073.1 hypothetical protein SEA_MUDSLIDE_55 [Mycobacterium phage Mudslide]
MSSGINWDGGGIPDAAHLRTLPDGTIISWLRVPGDRTSEAVAFVRREVSNESGFPQVDVWISPGGWDPQTIESAGVSFPAHVVRFGEFNPEHYLGAELPLLSETLASGVLDHGGTWAREKALECASRVNTGRGGPAAITLAMASEFQDYLEADDEEPGTEIVQVTVDVTVHPYGEVRVRYSDGRVDELSVDQWEGPKPVRNAPVIDMTPGTVGEAIGNLRSALDVHADITTLRSHATHLLHVIDLWRNQK